MIAVQFILLTVAWVHGCIGLYFWLRLKPFFKWASPYLLAVAVLLPPLATLGTHQGARDVIRIASPQWRAEHVRGIPSEQRSLIDKICLSTSRSATLASSVSCLPHAGCARCASAEAA